MTPRIDPGSSRSVDELLAASAPGAVAMDILSTEFRKKGEFVTRLIAGETILVPVRGQIGDLDAIYNLNEVAAFIWKRVDGKTSVRHLIDAVAGEFEVSFETAEEDTLQFVHDLEAAGIIEASAKGGL